MAERHEKMASFRYFNAQMPICKASCPKKRREPAAIKPFVAGKVLFLLPWTISADLE